MTSENLDTIIYFLIVIMAVFIFVILVVGLILFFQDFSRELKIINCEINRTEGKERKYWIRRKRRLWLSLIPFVKYL